MQIRIPNVICTAHISFLMEPNGGGGGGVSEPPNTLPLCTRLLSSKKKEIN